MLARRCRHAIVLHACLANPRGKHKLRAMTTVSDTFYASVPTFVSFDTVLDASLYRAAPDDWIVGLSDITGSTKAIEAGKYKSVNMAGAAVIAAVSNALGNRVFPFAFGGDGASFVVPPQDGPAARAALAATSIWVREALDLDLRVGAVDVATLRRAGHDMRIARYAVSPHLSYAMFAGGGLAYAEDRLKEGDFAIAPSEASGPPDLSGLSCRWQPLAATHDFILSLIVVPAKGANKGEADPAFRRLVEDIVALSTDPARSARPVTNAKLVTKWPPPGIALEASAIGGNALLNKARLFVQTLLIQGIMKFNLKLGAFTPDAYKAAIVENSDFRKYGDGLRMTVDCTSGLADEIVARLDEATAAGVARYGVHRQSAALMTCIVPSVMTPDHFHFVDGADGGYAAAARNLKAAMAA